MYGVIYKVTNTINGKFYIGQTIMRLSARWSKHKQDARKGAGWVLAAAIRKYGEGAFKIEVVEYCEDKDSLNAAEVRLIADLKPHYNACAGGGGLGSPIPEVREKISRASKGRKISEETRARMSAAQKGHPVSPETAQKIQASLQPYYESLRQERIAKYGSDKIPKKPRKYVSPLDEYYVAVGATTKIEKITAAAKLGFVTGSRKKLKGADNPMFGKPKPEHIKQKLSEQMTGEGNPFSGRSHSEETRAKMKAAHAARQPVQCPRCGKEGHLNTMKRWHFDNCRRKA